MYRPNIISAGRMMAFVLMLFGILHCGATFIPFVQDELTAIPHRFFSSVFFYSFTSGILLLFCGILLVAMLGKADGHPVLATPILMIGVFVFIYGILCVAFLYRNPFSWMTAILGIAIFVDTLCLKLSLDKEKKRKNRRI